MSNLKLIENEGEKIKIIVSYNISLMHYKIQTTIHSEDDIISSIEDILDDIEDNRIMPNIHIRAENTIIFISLIPRFNQSGYFVKDDIIKFLKENLNSISNDEQYQKAKNEHGKYEKHIFDICSEDQVWSFFMRMEYHDKKNNMDKVLWMDMPINVNKVSTLFKKCWNNQ
jgi:hypothetical protein